MKASELISQLQKLMTESGTDPEVLGQSHGCCYHGHDIQSVSFGEDRYNGWNTVGESEMILIRV